MFTRTLIPILHQKAKRGTPHQAKQAVHCIHAIFNNKEVQLAQIFEVGNHILIYKLPGIYFIVQQNILFILNCTVHKVPLSWFASFVLILSWHHACTHAVFLYYQPLSRSLNADVPEQLITPLVSLGHISMLAPDQFASPMKSIVANFIVKDLLMNDRVRGDWTMYSWKIVNAIGRFLHFSVLLSTKEKKTVFVIYLSL